MATKRVLSASLNICSVIGQQFCTSLHLYLLDEEDLWLLCADHNGNVEHFSFESNKYGTQKTSGMLAQEPENLEGNGAQIRNP